MQTWYKIIQYLADGRFHSGEELAAVFGVSRAAIWKQLARIRQLPGVEIDAVTGRGYRLRGGLELLASEHLLAHLSPQVVDRLQQLHLLPSVDSTNAFLSQQPRPESGKAQVCLAEHQTAGRGRRGRQWVSGFGRNITLSLAWTFDLPMMALSGVSLAVGVALARALSRAGLRGHGLKWPNDIHLDGRKLAGLLVEASGEADGPTRAIIGIGVNLSLGAAASEQIDQPWTDLQQTAVAGISRNLLSGLILDEVLSALIEYQRQGLQAFVDAWQQYDLYAGQEVRLLQGEQVIPGRYLGLADDGGLRLLTAQGERVYQAGEVSLRAEALL